MNVNRLELLVDVLGALQAERRKQEDELKKVREQEEQFQRIKVRVII